MGLIGGVVGALGGVLLQQLFPLILQDFLAFEVVISWVCPPVFQGILLGISMSVLFALLPLLGTWFVSPLQVLRIQLIGQEFVRRALVDEQRHGLGARFDEAGGIVGLPAFPVVAQVGAETALAPAAHHRVVDGREGRHRPIAARILQGADQRAVTAHGMSADAAQARDQRQAGFHQRRQFARDIVVHVVVLGPGLPGGVDIKARALAEVGAEPDVVIGCVGGGSNAIGLFHPFLEDDGVAMYGVEAAGDGLDTGHHAAPLCAGTPGVLHGNRTYLMEDPDGQIIETHSISAGLDYPGVGPEHAWLKDSGRAKYVSVNDDEALQAFHDVTRTEGIIPALESSHALAYVTKLAPTMRPDQSILVNLSGRGDKDMHTVAATEGIDL